LCNSAHNEEENRPVSDNTPAAQHLLWLTNVGLATLNHVRFRAYDNRGSAMKPIAHTFRCLLVAMTAMSVVASPAMAHVAAGCKNDGAQLSSHHHPDCCCGTTCHCAHCPGADSGTHTPPPAPTVPDDGRGVVKIQSQALEVCTDFVAEPRQVVECTNPFLATANLSSTLIAKHTCLQV
jgi:hypothetical protein